MFIFNESLSILFYSISEIVCSDIICGEMRVLKNDVVSMQLI